jgi:integration host factor beta subunit
LPAPIPGCRECPKKPARSLLDTILLKIWNKEFRRMTKSELVERLVDQNSLLTRKDSELIVDIVFDSIRTALKNDEKVEIRGFGSFTIRERGPREARNPKSGEIVQIPAKKTPFFKTGKELRDRVNNS